MHRRCKWADINVNLNKCLFPKKHQYARSQLMYDVYVFFMTILRQFIILIAIALFSFLPSIVHDLSVLLITEVEHCLGLQELKKN